MSSIVRASKYRHVFSEGTKSEHQFTNINLSTQTGDHTYIKGSTKFFSVATRGGGGPVLVLPIDSPCRLDTGHPLILGHHGAVYDTDWNPFNPNLLATASDDCTVKAWVVPDGGLTANMTDPVVDLKGHSKPVTFCQFNPCANNILATASKDGTCRIWDIEAQEEKLNVSGWGGMVQDLQWDREGKQALISSKDKTFRVYDPRSGAVAAEWQAHEGAKTAKAAWMEAGSGKVLTVGFTKQSGREMRLWDLRDTSKKLKKAEIDTASGVIFPFYDPDTRLLYLCGKGDGNVRYYEMTDDKPFIFPISEYRSSVSAKGMTMLPKRACDVLHCEVAHFLKLTSTAVEPLHFKVPRKSESFQDDLFPDHPTGAAGTTADEWLGGTDKPCPTGSMDPSKAGAAKSGGFKAKKSAAQLQEELDTALARIAELEAEVARLNAGSGAGAGTA